MCVFVSLWSWNANDRIGCISCRREVSHFVAAGFGAAGGKGTDYLSAGQKARVCTCNFETKGEIKGELVKRVVA